MKKKIFSLCFSLLVFLPTPTFAQGPGEPYFPETANGAKNAYFQYQSLRWQNPIGTVYNEIYIHYDSSKVANMDQSALYVSGFPSTTFDSIRINQQLYKPARYFWCVVEHGSSSFTQGKIWHFTTTYNGIDFYYLDDFSFGLGKWNINNVGGCGWQIGESINYTIPPPSTAKLLRADKNLCGNTINATATYQQVSIMKYMYFAWLEFDSDWKVANSNDYAAVQVRLNSGSWSTIWQKIGESDRNAHLLLSLFDSNWNPDTIYSVTVRFVTNQYGADSWWAIDNVNILGNTGLLSHFHPYITNVKVNYANQPKMIVKFQVGIPLDVRVERKTGLPLDATNYQVLAIYYSTYNNTYIDSTITDSTIYTYRVGVKEGFPGNQWYTYSNEATGYVFPTIPVELQSFTAEVSDYDVKLLWSTATETNNSGFEIQRTSPLPSPYKGEGVPTSRDGRGWENIGFVPGFGTTTEIHHYTFNDGSLQSGNYQYRLKQIDFDGSFEYSNIIEITVETPLKYALEQNYPNPFNPTTKIKYSIPSVEPHRDAPQQVKLTVYDVLGNEVTTLVNEQKPAGTYEVEFNATELPSGIYFYQLLVPALQSKDGKAGSFIETKKMVLMK